MKRFLSIAVSAVLALSMATACTSKSPTPASSSGGGTPSTEAPTDTSTDTSTESDAPTTADTGSPDVAAGEIVKLGLGHITSMGSSKDYSDAGDTEVLALGQVDTVIAAVGFDKDGKVVSVTIDNAQTKVNFDKDMNLTSDLSAQNKTKLELGEDYGMKRASGIGKEWFEQSIALGDWMKGKTIDEIKAIQTEEKDASHPAVPTDPELTSSVTISVESYIAAVVEAYENSISVPGATKVGLGHEISISSSKGYSQNGDTEVMPLAQVDTTIAAAAIAADGTIAGIITDVAQTKVNFDKDGKVTSDKSAEIKTKAELGDDYGMIRASGIGKEWHEQNTALAEWMAGKTIDEVKNLKTYQKDDSHPAVPEDPELTSSVTMTVGDFLLAAEEAYKNAK